MRKILISILVIGMLLTTLPLGIVGQEAVVNETQSFVKESLYLENNYFNRHIVRNGDSIEYKYDDNSEILPRFVPGELIVKFEDDVQIEIQESTNGILGIGVEDTFGGMLTTGIESIDQLNNQYNVISIEELFADTTISSLSNIYKFNFPVDSEIMEIMSKYNSDDNVVYAEPNYLFTTSYALPPPKRLIPNDPLFNQQWALNQTGDHDIDAPEAWNIKTGDTSVFIAIVDTGVDYNHNDLEDNIWLDPVYGNPGYDFVDINTNEYTDYGFVLCSDEDYTLLDNNPMDVFGHGTHCAGIASAVTNNSVGVSGVGWNCKIMPVRNGFKIDDGFGDIYGMMEDDDSANAIIYAADHGADVISMSWGGMYDTQLIKDALDYAYSKGVVLVAAAGNDNFELKSYPGAYDNVISVGATDENDERADFSTYGDWIDVAAPGVDILSTIPGNQYVEHSGTSMATPLVAGVAGLLISKNPQCPYPAYLARSMIPFTADKIQTDHYIGKGRVNVYKALVQKPFAAVLDSIDNWEDVKGTIDIRGAAWGENFQYYKIEDGLGENPSSWTTLKTSYKSQVGVLLSLNTEQLVEGLHTIRLKVVYSYATFTEKILIYVNNLADGSYSANIFVSNCFDSSTPGWGVTKFSSIQDGIDHAQSGKIIFVYDGVYPENINISGLSKSSISLIGQNNKWTIIEGGIGISLTTKVTVRGFCVRGALFKYALGIPILGCLNGALILKGCSKCEISHNNIIMDEPWGYYNGISLYVSTNNIVSENTLVGFRVPSYYWYGILDFGIIMMYSTSDTVSDNIIYDFEKNIIIELSSKSKILNNNMEGGDWGIIGAGFTDCLIENNIVIKKIGIGIDIILVKRNKIMKNTFMEEEWTIHVLLLEGAKYNVIVANHIEVIEGGPGIRLDQPSNNEPENNSCFHNKIYYNNFINTVGKDHGGKDSTNIWYKEKIFGYDKGNYWSYYPAWHRDPQYGYGTEPKDNNHGVNQNIPGSDGIWDDPMKILMSGWDGDLNEDKYPVIEPFDIDNIDLSLEITEGMTVEESELLVQIEETINNQILSGELNTNEITNSYMSIFSDTISQSQQSSQQGSTTQQSITGSSTTSK